MEGKKKPDRIPPERTSDEDAVRRNIGVFVWWQVKEDKVRRGSGTRLVQTSQNQQKITKRCRFPRNLRHGADRRENVKLKGKMPPKRRKGRLGNAQKIKTLSAKMLVHGGIPVKGNHSIRKREEPPQKAPGLLIGGFNVQTAKKGSPKEKTERKRNRQQEMDQKAVEATVRKSKAMRNQKKSVKKVTPKERDRQVVLGSSQESGRKKRGVRNRSS